MHRLHHYDQWHRLVGGLNDTRQAEPAAAAAPPPASEPVLCGVPADKWLYGDFSQIVVGMWGVLDLKPDPYALAGSDGLMLRVFQDVDTAIRRKEAFCLANKTP